MKKASGLTSLSLQVQRREQFFLRLLGKLFVKKLNLWFKRKAGGQVNSTLCIFSRFHLTFVIFPQMWANEDSASLVGHRNGRWERVRGVHLPLAIRDVASPVIILIRKPSGDIGSADLKKCCRLGNVSRML